MFQRFSEVLSETLSEADFPLRGSHFCCPYLCCPLNILQGDVLVFHQRCWIQCGQHFRNQ